MANNEDRLVGSTQTNKNLEMNTEDLTQVQWDRQIMKIGVPSEATDSFLKFEIFNNTSKQVVSYGELYFDEIVKNGV